MRLRCLRGGLLLRAVAVPFCLCSSRLACLAAFRGSLVDKGGRWETGALLLGPRLCVMMSVYGGAGWPPPFSVAVLLPQLLTLICYGLNELNFLHIMYCTITMPLSLMAKFSL
jgi:hypothetical protein